jgi:hypothetical protein
MFCKNCGKEISDKAVACIGCGMSPKDGGTHCGTCGAETKEKQIICTACGSSLKQGYTDGWPPIAMRFLISFVWSLVFFILIIIGTQAQNQWLVGFIGSAVFALLSGVIAMAIKTKRKIIFVPISLLVSFFIAVIKGGT